MAENRSAAIALRGLRLNMPAAKAARAPVKPNGRTANKLFTVLKYAAALVLCACIPASCASLHAYSIVLGMPYDGNTVLENEVHVVSYLENVLQNYSGYGMRAFDRKAISHEVKKTNITTHSFYIIYMADGTYHTLSFSATGKWATSEGAWAMDTTPDIASYTDYVSGTNKWEVREITTGNGINTLLTIENVLAKIQNNTTYYFRSQINRENNHDNCNTALFETLVENE
ncbi:MAG: hypothetical protein LBC88_04440 [Spirochaetaceae bacterium]|jgi:hypothetical protein|nr:hypothetical protein [Spirochaetaceae bacterium]